jgi:predicted Zn-dependent protease
MNPWGKIIRWMLSASVCLAMGARAQDAPAEAAAGTVEMVKTARPGDSAAAAVMDRLATLTAKPGAPPKETREAQIHELAQKTAEAIRLGDFARAEPWLDALQRFLPAQSLTLLRLRAWHAFASGREEEAGRLYRRILARLGNDENAGINLAILEARAGREEEAARILARLSGRFPDSPRLDAMRQAIGSAREATLSGNAVFQRGQR